MARRLSAQDKDSSHLSLFLKSSWILFETCHGAVYTDGPNQSPLSARKGTRSPRVLGEVGKAAGVGTVSLEGWWVNLRILSPIKAFSQYIFMSLISWLLGSLQALRWMGSRDQTLALSGRNTGIIWAGNHRVLWACSVQGKLIGTEAPSWIINGHCKSGISYGVDVKEASWGLIVGQGPGLEGSQQEWWPWHPRSKWQVTGSWG